MAIDFEAIRKKLNQLSGVNSKRRVMWRPQEGEEHVVRLIAFTDNDGNPFQERWFYYNIGNNPGLLAPSQFGKPDPINELIQKLKDEGTKESYEMAKRLYPKMRVYAAVIVRGEEDQGVRLWAFGKTVYQNLLNVMLDPDYGDITDVSEGHDVKVICTKAPGRQWATTEVRPRPKASAAGEASQVKEWVDNIPSVDDVFTLKSHDELEGIINAWLNGEDSSAFNSEGTTKGSTPGSAPAPVVKPQAQAAKKEATAEKTFDDLDDAFADLEADLDF
jgi:hypothetical protein